MALGAEVVQSCAPELFMRVGSPESHGAFGPWAMLTPSLSLADVVVGRPDWEAASLTQLSSQRRLSTDRPRLYIEAYSSASPVQLYFSRGN